MPRRIRLEWRDNQLTMFTRNPGSELAMSAPVTNKLGDPVHVGLAACSHYDMVIETAILTNVSITPTDQ